MAYPTRDALNRTASVAFASGIRVIDRAPFPSIETANLAGRRTLVPVSHVGEPTLLPVGFQRRQRERLRRKVPALAVYEVAIARRGYPPARPSLGDEIGRDHRIHDAPARTLTAYVSAARVAADPGLAGSESVALRLLDHSGRVIRAGRRVDDTDRLTDLRHAVVEMDGGLAIAQENER